MFQFDSKMSCLKKILCVCKNVILNCMRTAVNRICKSIFYMYLHCKKSSRAIAGVSL